MKYCPVCGDPLEDGYCLNCGFDLYMDGDLGTGMLYDKPKHDDSLFDDLLGILSDE